MSPAAVVLKTIQRLVPDEADQRELIDALGLEDPTIDFESAKASAPLATNHPKAGARESSSPTKPSRNVRGMTTPPGLANLKTIEEPAPAPQEAARTYRWTPAPVRKLRGLRPAPPGRHESRRHRRCLQGGRAPVPHRSPATTRSSEGAGSMSSWPGPRSRLPQIRLDGWRAQAACSTRAAEGLWDDLLEHESEVRRRSRHGEAMTICRTACPVREQCAADVDWRYDDGIRGGHKLPSLGHTRSDEDSLLLDLLKTGLPLDDAARVLRYA